MDKYNQTEWKRRGHGANGPIIVSISRNTTEGYCGRGPYGWCLYGTIGRHHPLFKEIDPNGDEYQDALGDLPLHSECTYFEAIYDKIGVTSYKFGCDYQHLGDDHYTHRDDPECILRDADKLYDYLMEDV